MRSRGERRSSPSSFPVVEPRPVGYTAGGVNDQTILAGRSGARRVLRKKGQLPVLPVLILLIMVFSGIMAPWIAPHDPLVASLSDRNDPPAWFAEGSANYLLGTDHLGRDLLSRILHGARISLILAAVTLGVGGGFGILMGLISGWYGGWVDDIVMRLVDIVLAVPLILVALVVVVAIGQGLDIIVLVMAIGVWPRFARMVRGEVLRLKEMDYVAITRVYGASSWRIIFRHLFPGVINTVIVLATLQVGLIIILEATLSFLGVGIPPPTPAWGAMVADGRDRLVGAWWIATLPGVALLLTVLAMNLFGDWLRDTLDPMLRQVE